MVRKRRNDADGQNREERHPSEDHLALIVLVGCLFAYVAWHFLSRGQMLPAGLAPNLATSAPPWLLASITVAATLAAAVLALWLHHRWARRLGRQVAHALIQAGLEGRNPKNPDKPIRPRLRSMRRDGKDVWLMAFRMPVKGSAITLDQIRPHLEQHLDCSIQTWADGGLVWLRVGTRRMPRLVAFDELARAPDGKDLSVAVGVSREGELVVDLTDLPHLLVGGTTGAGKSVFLRVLLTRLALTCPPEHLRLVLADLKGGMEFTLFKSLPHLFCPVISDRDGFLESMEVVCAELVRRMKLYGEREVESLSRWNQEHPDQRMPYLVVVVDELAEVTSKGIGDEQAQRRRAVHAISQIARLGRAVGIHMILCTQRPDAEIVEGQAKSNMGATLAFRTRDAIQSQILLGPGDVTASQIPAGIPGRGIWKWIDAGIQVQTLLLEVERARELLSGIKEVPPAQSRKCPAYGPVGPGLTRIQPEPASCGMAETCAASTGKSEGTGGFDVTRLAVGRRYEFRLSNGDTVVGVLRALEVPVEEGGEGAQTMLVASDSQDHHLDRGSVVDVRRSRRET